MRQAAARKKPPSPRGRGTADRRWRDNLGDLPLCGSIPQSTYGCQPSYASLRIGSANQIKDLERRVPLGKGALRPPAVFKKPIGGNLPPVSSPLY